MKNRWFVVVVGVVGLLLAGACSSETEAEAPTLSVDVDSHVTYTANEDRVRIELQASDPQGQSLQFDLVEGPDAAEFYTFDTSAVFNWTPHAGDITEHDPHRLVFSVTNEAGKTAERTVYVEVVGTGGAYFTNSASQLYDPSSGQPLMFEVEVQHDEASSVHLDMPSETAPDGAMFVQTGEFRGEFEWQPSPSQREQRTHTVVFEADDGDEIYDQEVTIIFQNVDTGQAPGDGEDDFCDDLPIDHDPVPVGEGSSSYSVEADIVDTSRDWEEAVLSWTFDDPLGEEPEWDSTEMQLEGDRISGEIPNPLLSSGEVVEVSYSMCVFDGTTHEEGVICGPEEFFFRFAAYSPDDDGCVGDGQDLSDPSRAAEMSTTQWESFRVCEDEPNYHRVEVGEGEYGEVAISYPVERSPQIEMHHDGAPLEVMDFPCIGLAIGFVEEPGTIEANVVDDHFPYHITAFVEDLDGGQCLVEYDSPQDAKVVDDPFFVLDDQQICDDADIDVYAIDALRGDEIDAYYTFDPAAADLGMGLYAPSQQDEIVDGGDGVVHADPSDGDDFFIHQATETGQYYVVVYSAGMPGFYDISTGRICQIDDSFAGNHSFDDAEDLQLDSFPDLKGCAGTSDWYSYTHGGSSLELVAARVYVYEGDGESVQLNVYDDDGQPLDDDDVIYEETTSIKEVIVEAYPDQELNFEVDTSADIIYEFELEEWN